jgi:hypothetical protein
VPPTRHGAERLQEIAIEGANGPVIAAGLNKQREVIECPLASASIFDAARAGGVV